VPDEVYEHFSAGIGERGDQARKDWTAFFAAYRAKYLELAKDIKFLSSRILFLAIYLPSWDCTR
jgi:transketolase